MTLRTRIFSFNLISVLLATFVVAIVGLKIVESTVIDNTYERLAQARNNKTATIENYLTNLRFNTSLLSSNKIISHLLTNKDSESFAESLQALDKYASILKVYDIILLDTRGRIVFSKRKDWKDGISVLSNDPSHKRLKSLFSWSINSAKDSTLFLDFTKDDLNPDVLTGVYAAPVYKKNKLKGLIILKASVSEIDRITSNNLMWSKDGLGLTGETLIYGQDWSLRNKSRFQQSPALTMGDEDTKKIESLAELREMGTDYRKQKVIRDLGKINLPNGNFWYIETKIDKSEAFAVLDRIAIASTAAGVLIFILFFIITFAATRKVVEPIELLTEHLEKLGTSNLTEKIKYNSKDEIGLLVEKYNQVATRLESTTVSKKFLDSVIQSINALLFIVKVRHNDDWKLSTYTISQANETAFKILGLSPQSLLQTDLRHLIQTDAEFRNYHWLLQTRHSIEAEIINFEQERVPVLVNWAVLPNHSDDEFTFVFVCTDIKDRIAAEQALIEARKQAETASVAKSEFLARMSHEIRTPLNAIIGVTDILAESNLKSEQQQMIQICKKAGENLLALVNDILDMAKIDAGEIHLERISFDLEVTTRTLCEIFKPKALEKDLKFNLNIDLGKEHHFIVTDPTRLRQVLFNLIGNSIKFTNKGEITVVIEFENSEKQFVHFSITDTGVGIPISKQPFIFQSFVQADSSITRKYGGSGLGLAICKNLVTLMGGRIWFESEEGKGSTFHFIIPYLQDLVSQKVVDASQTLTSADHFSYKTESDSKKPKILIVDDTEDNRFLLLTYLKNFPFEIMEAQNGKEALDKIFKEKVDLVLMDIQMPIMDGYEATRRIRQCEAKFHKKAMPIIAVSANAMLEDIQRSLDAGCTEHLTKPVKKTSLLEMIQKYTA
ncbi:MAG: ATP-binding protein [Bdellovibrio sp.]